MTISRILPAIMSAAALAVVLTIFHPLTAEAAPKRTYRCGDSGRLIVTVLSQEKIRVVVDMPGSSDGKFTMEMDRQGKGFHFVKDEYEVKVAKDQNSLSYSAPDFGTANCVWNGK